VAYIAVLAFASTGMGVDAASTTATAASLVGRQSARNTALPSVQAAARKPTRALGTGAPGQDVVPGRPAGRGGQITPQASAPPAPQSTDEGRAGKARAARGDARPTNRPVIEAEASRTDGTGGEALAPSLGGSFLVGPQQNSIPPDPTLAVGPYNLVAVTNDAVSVFKKNGTGVQTLGLAAFFGTTDNTFDPKALYDPYVNRFWIVAASVNPNPPWSPGPRRSNILVAVSDDDDATGPWSSWTVYALDATLDGVEVSNNWCDYPQVGMDLLSLYVTCNMFVFGTNPSDYAYAKIRVLRKGQLLSGACCGWYDFWDLDDAVFFPSFTIQPAQTYGAGEGTPEFLVNAHGNGGADNEFSIWIIRDGFRCCGGVSGAPTLEGANYTVGDFDTPPNARQAGTSTLIDTGDSRLQYAFWRDGRLSTGQTTACNDGSDACVAYTEIDVLGGFCCLNTVQDFVIGTPGLDYYYPAGSVNAAGDRTIIYARSSATDFAGAFYAGVSAGAFSCTPDFCPFHPIDSEAVLQAGQGSYVQFDTAPTPRNRWGDYLGAAPDPDGTGVWIHGEFASTGNLWATQVGLTYEPMDRTPPTSFAILNRTPSEFGWHQGDVHVTLAGSDGGGSGMRFLTYQAVGAQPIPQTTVLLGDSVTISAEGTTVLSFFAEDRWGNVEAPPNTRTIRIDRTDPVVTCDAPDGRWHADNVAIHCSALDALSGLADAANVSFSLWTSVPDRSEDALAFTDSRTVCDRALNCVTVGPIGPNMVDRKPPQITVLSPESRAYVLNEAVVADYSCVDLGSGVLSCEGPVPDGGSVDTESVGTKTFQVEAVDAVGNIAVRSIEYDVAFAICLGYDPGHVFHGGTVPIRLALCDDGGNNVSASDITATAVEIDPPMPLESRSNPDNVFRFDPTLEGGGGYVFNLEVRGFPAGTYALLFKAEGDPTVHSAPFTVG
jgi:hypothetical protein